MVLGRLTTLLRRLVPPRKLDPSRIFVRQLRRDDLERLFPPFELGLAEKWLAMQERGEIYVAVAEVDGAPVGRRCLQLQHLAASGVVYGFAASVLVEWRARGIGTLIDAHSEAIALAKGFRAMRCSVAKSNVRGQAWHERLGYRIIGERIVHWVEGDGREVTQDCWDFERPLKA
jgi:ribosomal protein S18 acetylase RimI-like enzyme